MKAGVAICFEDTDAAQMRELAKTGAKVLFFITNDSWFSQSVEAEQHAWQAVARAIETGLPVVRVGNSGGTGTITPDGKASWLVGPNGKPLVDCEGTMMDRILVRRGREDVRRETEDAGRETGDAGRETEDAGRETDDAGPEAEDVRRGDEGNELTLTVYAEVGDWPLGIVFALLILSMILVKYRTHYE